MVVVVLLVSIFEVDVFLAKVFVHNLRDELIIFDQDHFCLDCVLKLLLKVLKFSAVKLSDLRSLYFEADGYELLQEDPQFVQSRSALPHIVLLDENDFNQA